MLELVDGLALSLNNPFYLNLNISYETLMNSSLYELERYIEIIKKYEKQEKK